MRHTTIASIKEQIKNYNNNSDIKDLLKEMGVEQEMTLGDVVVENIMLDADEWDKRKKDEEYKKEDEETKEEEKKEEYMVMYRQYDGSSEGHGTELAKFLNGYTVVNGFSGNDKMENKVANRESCLSAQIVKHFKEEIGNIYLLPSGSRDCGEEYIYFVYVDKVPGEPKIRVYDSYSEKVTFDGTPAEFLQKQW